MNDYYIFLAITFPIMCGFIYCLYKHATLDTVEEARQKKAEKKVNP